jgi:hypothetical protein
MTIFGFNTDVKHGDMVYHVQSEARPSDLVVQTLVFMKGLCVGKRTVSYAQEASTPDFSDEAIHQLLKAQHRTVIDAINAGNMDSALGTVGEVQDIGGSGLSLRWIKADPIGSEGSFTLHLQVTDAGKAVAGAEAVARIGSEADAPVIARATSDNSGNIDMQIVLSDELRRESSLTVQATYGTKSATRKFRFKKANQQP